MEKEMPNIIFLLTIWTEFVLISIVIFIELHQVY